jgi:hypothetical protein
VQHFPGGPSVDGVSERELVESVLRDLREAADRWEAVVAQASTITYTVDMGDVHAVANSDGKLVDLTLHPNVMATYGHRQLSDRINVALAALRQEAQADYQARYGGTLQ